MTDGTQSTETNDDARHGEFSGLDSVAAARRDRAALMEARGIATKVIAEDLGVHDSTVRGYRMNPEYRAAVRAHRDEIYTAAISAAVQEADANVRVLSVIRDDDEVEPQHRIRAAAALNAMAQHGHSISVMGEKLDEVRKTLGLD